MTQDDRELVERMAKAMEPHVAMKPGICTYADGFHKYGDPYCEMQGEAIFAMAQAALRVVREAEGWRPISEAPFNQSVLIFIPNAEHYGHGVYRGLRVNMGTGERWHVSGLHMGKDCGAEYAPIKWQPLPQPPKPKENSDV